MPGSSGPSIRRRHNYSSLTTLDPAATARQLAALDALLAEGRAGSRSRTASAGWIPPSPPVGSTSSSRRPGSGRPRPPPQERRGRWERVTTPEALVAWEAAWAAAGSPTETRVFPAGCWQTRPSPSSAGAAGWATMPAASATAQRAASGCPTSSRQHPTPVLPRRRRRRRPSPPASRSSATIVARRLRRSGSGRLPRGRPTPCLGYPAVTARPCEGHIHLVSGSLPEPRGIAAARKACHANGLASPWNFLHDVADRG